MDWLEITANGLDHPLFFQQLYTGLSSDPGDGGQRTWSTRHQSTQRNTLVQAAVLGQTNGKYYFMNGDHYARVTGDYEVESGYPRTFGWNGLWDDFPGPYDAVCRHATDTSGRRDGCGCCRPANRAELDGGN